MRPPRRQEYPVKATLVANDYYQACSVFLPGNAAFVNSADAPIELKAGSVAQAMSALWQQFELAGIAEEVAKLMVGFVIRRRPDHGGPCGEDS